MKMIPNLTKDALTPSKWNKRTLARFVVIGVYLIVFLFFSQVNLLIKDYVQDTLNRKFYWYQAHSLDQPDACLLLLSPISNDEAFLVFNKLGLGKGEKGIAVKGEGVLADMHDKGVYCKGVSPENAILLAHKSSIRQLISLGTFIDLSYIVVISIMTWILFKLIGKKGRLNKNYNPNLPKKKWFAFLRKKTN